VLHIGIPEVNEWLVYEGDGTRGHALWPSPTLSIAAVLSAPIETNQLPRSDYIAEARFVFREDSFDPVTRIRRGRMYEATTTRPQEWRVPAHPVYQQEEESTIRHTGSLLRKRIYAFQAWRSIRGEPRGSTLIALGTAEAYTLWRIVDIERIITGEDLLTLRARNSLGVLPELNLDAIPQEDKDKLKEVIDQLTNSAYRSGPEDVIESARAATQWCLGVYLAKRDNDPKILQKDIGELVPLLEKSLVLKSIAQIFARLHSRAKPNEQERYDTRPLLDGDAEYALAAVGMLLRELGWAV
jgi:hypothetical protein